MNSTTAGEKSRSAFVTDCVPVSAARVNLVEGSSYASLKLVFQGRQLECVGLFIVKLDYNTEMNSTKVQNPRRNSQKQALEADNLHHWPEMATTVCVVLYHDICSCILRMRVRVPCSPSE